MTLYVIFASSKGWKDLEFVTPSINDARETSKKWHTLNPQINYKVYASFADGVICINNNPIFINGEIIIGKNQ